MNLQQTASAAFEEIRPVLDDRILSQIDELSEALAASKKIALYGVGREGLVMKALAMRLFHLGLGSHVVGDMSCPPIGDGDVLFVSAGPGDFSTVAGLVDVANGAGATTICITAVQDGRVARACSKTVIIDAQTMATDTGKDKTVLPMGSVYELQLFFFFEILVLKLQDALDTSAAAMRSNHTNLE